MTSANDPRPESSRRRIVVQLSQESRPARPWPATPGAMAPGSSAQRKGRVGKVLAILTVLVIFLVLTVAVGAFLWWQHYQTTPTYSLALLVDAAQRNDMPGVDKIVDSDKIVDNFAGQVMDKAAGRYGGALSGEVSKAIRVRVPVLLPHIKQQVRDAVAARVKEISSRADQKPFLVVALAMPYFVKVTTTGDKANSIINIHDKQLRMDLERSNDVWRVVAVQDDALLERMVDEVIKDLPAIGRGIESETRKSPARRSPALIPIR